VQQYFLQVSITCASVCSGEAHPVNEKRYPLNHMQEDCAAESKGLKACPWHPGWTLPHRLASVDIIGLFHFVTRSLEDYRTKMARAGGTNPKPKPIEFFDNWNRCDFFRWLDLKVIHWVVAWMR
jgi:hypothetical protein